MCSGMSSWGKSSRLARPATSSRRATASWSGSTSVQSQRRHGRRAIRLLQAGSPIAHLALAAFTTIGRRTLTPPFASPTKAPEVALHTAANPCGWCEVSRGLPVQMPMQARVIQRILSARSPARPLPQVMRLRPSPLGATKRRRRQYCPDVRRAPRAITRYVGSRCSVARLGSSIHTGDERETTTRPSPAVTRGNHRIRRPCDILPHGSPRGFVNGKASICGEHCIAPKRAGRAL